MAVSSSPLGRFHTPRLGARRTALEKIFSPSALEISWSTYVRDGLRKQEILDLHDYLDFHRNRKTLFAGLANEIVHGHYAPSTSLPVRVEKKNGVTRTLVTPCPEDAVVLQCIVEMLYPAARRHQPSQNSFFSRSHGFNKPELNFHKDYIWFKRWAEFSKIRFDMVSTHKFLCVTDIANYFDNIDYRHLRNVITTLDAFDEVILDILFLVLDMISWRPDYLPSPARSLPQVNFDAPRLLSHIFLFEIDIFLKSKSDDHFVRWVDDITVAVNSRSEGKEILRDLDELLMTRGLRLNSGKTIILNAAEARKYFWQSENRFLDEQKKRIDSSKGDARSLGALGRTLRRRFDRVYIAERRGHWEKIVKRYVSLFTKLEDNYLLSKCGHLIESEPSLREGLWRYLSKLGPDNRSFAAISHYLTSENALDDASIFQAAQALIQWPVTPQSYLHKRIRALGRTLGEDAYVLKSPMFFLASLWMLGKYGTRSHVFNLIVLHKQIWRTSSFLSRRVASMLPKFRRHGREANIRRLIEKHKHPAATSVLLSLDNIDDCGQPIPKDLKLYALNGRRRGQWTLQRFLICLHLLLSERIPLPERDSLRTEILRYITDPLYQLVLNKLRI